MSGSSRIRLEEETAPPPEEHKPPPEPTPEPPREPEPAPAPPPRPAPGGGSAAAAEPEPEREHATELSPDVKKRIDRLNWEKYEAKRQYDELARQMQTMAQQQRAQAGPGAEAEERALQRYRQEAAERDFNAQCNEVFRKGSAEYQDFSEAVRSLNAVGYGSRPDALAAIAALPEGHHVYRELAQDLDRAARVLNLPPMQMAMELTRIAASRAAAAPASAPAPAAAQVTRAPAPLRPVGGNSARGEVPLEKTTMAEFIRRRDRDERGGSQRIKRG